MSGGAFFVVIAMIALILFLIWLFEGKPNWFKDDH